MAVRHGIRRDAPGADRHSTPATSWRSPAADGRAPAAADLRATVRDRRPRRPRPPRPGRNGAIVDQIVAAEASGAGDVIVLAGPDRAPGCQDPAGELRRRAPRSRRATSARHQARATGAREARADAADLGVLRRRTLAALGLVVALIVLRARDSGPSAASAVPREDTRPSRARHGRRRPRRASPPVPRPARAGPCATFRLRPLPSQPSPESAGPAGDPEPPVTQPVDLASGPGTRLMGVLRVRPSHEILSGESADVYFARAESILEREGLDPMVAMEVFSRQAGILCGIDEAKNLWATSSRDADPAEIAVEALDDGDAFAPEGGRPPDPGPLPPVRAVRDRDPRHARPVDRLGDGRPRVRRGGRAAPGHLVRGPARPPGHHRRARLRGDRRRLRRGVDAGRRAAGRASTRRARCPTRWC